MLPACFLFEEVDKCLEHDVSGSFIRDRFVTEYIIYREMLRKAKIADAKGIYRLISFWAKKNKVLERPLNYIYENIRDFWICTQNRRIIGSCALHVIGWEDLAEIKSLVVDKRKHKKGIGKELVEACVKEAKSLGVKNIFVLTFVETFFRHLGFKKLSKNKLPHKIWSDCINCVYFPNCKEESLILNIGGRR